MSLPVAKKIQVFFPIIKQICQVTFHYKVNLPDVLTGCKENTTSILSHYKADMPGVITHYKEIQVFFPILKQICQVSSLFIKQIRIPRVLTNYKANTTSVLSHYKANMPGVVTHYKANMPRVLTS